jgi:glycerol 3-phosphatase-2
MTLSLNEIIDVYEASKHWYDTPLKTPENIIETSGLKECLHEIDLVLLDSYGVLCRGKDVIPEALGAIQYLRENNIPFCVVSNDTMNGQRTVEEKYKKLGFDFKKSEIVTSLDVTEEYLKEVASLENFAATGISDNGVQIKHEEMQDLNALEGHLNETIHNLMFLLGTGWQKSWQENLVSSKHHLQDLFIANPDVGAPEGDVFVPTPGFYAYDFYKRTAFSKKPILLGKPSPIIFEHALEFMGYKGDAQNVLMVGDSLHTDILGGLNMGFKTLLVESGMFRGGEADEYIHKTGIRPHYIAKTI